jgi:arabinose-5-phosphate isomerase
VLVSNVGFFSTIPNLCRKKKSLTFAKNYMSSNDTVYQTALRTIHIEIAALEALAASLEQDPDFLRCVAFIVASKGRLVVTGIGKSASVAQKIVATLNSTGQPSLFLHAADAIHGDIGMIQRGDIVLCLSKSGETPEIKVLAPLVKNFGNTMIAMTANRQSFLATTADFVLFTPIEREADPNNLAPTASTTAQMALGDALATALLAQRGFSSDDFARFHPGGALGKQLYLRVEDLYKNHGRPAVSIHAQLTEILLEISGKRLGATAVLDDDGQLTGIITDGDLRRMLERKDIDFYQLSANDIQTRSARSIMPDAMAVEALEKMRTNAVSQLLVLDDASNYLGMIHLHDLVKEGLI